MSVSNSIIRSGLSVSDLKGVPWCLENSLLTFKFFGFQNSFYTLLWGNTGFQTRCMCWILLSKKYIQLQSTSTAPVRLLPACDDHSWEVIQWIQIYSSFWAGFAWDDPAGWQTLSIPVWEAWTAQWHQPAPASRAMDLPVRGWRGWRGRCCPDLLLTFHRAPWAMGAAWVMPFYLLV